MHVAQWIRASASDFVRIIVWAGGLLCILLVAGQLIRALEQPASSSPPAVPTAADADKPGVKSYAVPPNRLAVVAQRLRTRFAATPGIRIQADRRTGNLLILAPMGIHREIETLLSEMRQEEAPSSRPTSPATEPRRGQAEQRVSRQGVRLRNMTWRQLEATVHKLWGKRMSASTQRGEKIATFELPAGRGQKILMHVDRRAGHVEIIGPEDLAVAWARVIAVLDSRPVKADDRTELVPVRNARRTSIKQAVAVLQSARQPAPGDGAGDQGQAAGSPGAGDEGGGLLGPVEIEYIEGLDMIIIKGNTRDVARVRQIIHEIEQLSAETEPIIEVYYLLHADSEAIATLLVETQVYENALQARHGQVSITGLGKPNALLLIGREETVNAVVDLIKRLDVPVAPATQFHVFRLVHVPALEAQATVLAFFTSSTGLRNRAEVIADFRTNSLIVRASPRDLVEVERLLQSIDVNESPAVNQVRVFPLLNSSAEQLAPMLEEALTGGRAAAGRAAPAATRPTPGAPGQAPPPTAFGQQTPTTGPRPGSAAGAQGAQPRSSMLELMTVDSGVIKSGILSDVRVRANVQNNTLIVTAPAESMELITELIRRLDQLPAADAQIKVFTMKNGDAFAVAFVLLDLFPQQQAPGQAPIQTAAGEGESALVPLRLSVDQRTNSIIASGSPGALLTVEAIIATLDIGGVRERVTRVYRLRNSPAQFIADAINEFLLTEQQIQFVQPGLVSPFEQMEREVVVVAESVSNSLVIAATPRYIKDIEQIIKELDKPQPQVLIQVLIAEVELDSAEEFGVDLGIQDSLLFDRGVILGGASAPALFNAGENLAGQAISDFAVGRSNVDLGYGGLVLQAGSESVSILLRALASEGRLEILSRPQIMTLDNQAAFIQVGSRISRITGSSVSQNFITNQVVDENIGLILLVTPRIDPDQLISMQIDVENSVLGSEVDGTPISVTDEGVVRSPPINTKTARTTVAARHGQTVVLGGLISKTTASELRAIPYLSDLPLLGGLFRFESFVERRTELLIIMTPYIVDSNEDRELIKQIEAERMNWCLADVVEIHGDFGLGGGHHLWQGNSAMTIFPDENPTAPHELTTPPGQPDQLEGLRIEPKSAEGQPPLSFKNTGLLAPHTSRINAGWNGRRDGLPRAGAELAGPNAVEPAAFQGSPAGAFERDRGSGNYELRPIRLPAAR